MSMKRIKKRSIWFFSSLNKNIRKANDKSKKVVRLMFLFNKKRKESNASLFLLLDINFEISPNFCEQCVYITYMYIQ